MICQPCADAARDQLPKAAHCNDEDQTQCMCQHRTNRYATSPNPAFLPEPSSNGHGG